MARPVYIQGAQHLYFREQCGKTWSAENLTMYVARESLADAKNSNKCLYSHSAGAIFE